MLCSLQWRHNGRDGVSNHQPHHCLLNRLFKCRSKKTSKLRVTGLCAGNSPGTGEFPAQMTSNAEVFPFDSVIMLWFKQRPVLHTRFKGGSLVLTKPRDKGVKRLNVSLPFTMTCHDCNIYNILRYMIDVLVRHYRNSFRILQTVSIVTFSDLNHFHAKPYLGHIYIS